MSDILDFLNLMLECERAGAKALRHFTDDSPPGPLAVALPDLFRDEARYCGGLSKHIVRLGGAPTSRTGDFLDKILAAPDWPSRLDLLVRGQRWVARRIEERLPSVDDPDLKDFLEEMHSTHLVNVAEAQRIAESLGVE